MEFSFFSLGFLDSPHYAMLRCIETTPTYLRNTAQANIEQLENSLMFSTATTATFRGLECLRRKVEPTQSSPTEEREELFLLGPSE
jgi:hypothetical protein